MPKNAPEINQEVQNPSSQQDEDHESQPYLNKGTQRKSRIVDDMVNVVQPSLAEKGKETREDSKQEEEKQNKTKGALETGQEFSESNL